VKPGQPRPAPRGPSHRVPSKAPEPATLRQADELAVIFKMLSNVNRLKILVYLDRSERTVSEIETTLKIRQPTLSQQLGELRDAALIVRRRVAKSAIYALTADRGRRALHTIYMASNRKVQPIDAKGRTTRRTSSQPAAVFASMIAAPKSAADEWSVGFNCDLARPMTHVLSPAGLEVSGSGSPLCK
jgi:DNA-binding transcriptional ArsR family regulator